MTLFLGYMIGGEQFLQAAGFLALVCAGLFCVFGLVFLICEIVKWVGQKH